MIWYVIIFYLFCTLAMYLIQIKAINEIADGDVIEAIKFIWKIDGDELPDILQDESKFDYVAAVFWLVLFLYSFIWPRTVYRSIKKRLLKK